MAIAATTPKIEAPLTPAVGVICSKASHSGLEEAGREVMIHEILPKKPLSTYATQGRGIFEEALQFSSFHRLHP
jgi:hypothetical protein